MAALATKADLAARLGRDITCDEDARLDALLADASALVRGYTGQDFGPATSTVILRAQAGMITLPQRPVVSVASVTAIGISGVPDVALIDYWWDGLDKIRLGEGNCVINLPEVWWDDDDGYPGTFSVTYSHGADEVPPDVVMVVCGMVLRTVTAPTSVGGVTSETIGPYSYRLESAGIGTGVALGEMERTTLARYRRTAGTISLKAG